MNGKPNTPGGSRRPHFYLSCFDKKFNLDTFAETELLENLENPYKIVDLKDNEQRADILIKVFTSFGIILAVGSGSTLYQVNLLSQIQDNIRIEESILINSDMIHSIFGMVQFLLYIVTIIVFIRWFRRAYFNLHLYKRRNLRHSEAMAAYSFFIPILFLFYPVQIMNDIWSKTQEEIANFGDNIRVKDKTDLISIWWALFVISQIFGQILFRFTLQAETIDDLLLSSRLTLYSDLFQVLEAIVVILLVKKVSIKEKQLYRLNNEHQSFEDFETLD